MPKEIAPHLNKELTLVKKGTKPRGSVHMGSTEASEIIADKAMYHYLSGGVLYFSLTQTPINTYKFLSSSGAAIILRSKQEKNRLLGRLFGYTEDEIDVFIEANLDCQCQDCVGVFNGN